MDSARNAQDEWNGEGPPQPSCGRPEFPEEKAQPALRERIHSRAQSIRLEHSYKAAIGGRKTAS